MRSASKSQCTHDVHQLRSQATSLNMTLKLRGFDACVRWHSFRLTISSVMQCSCLERALKTQFKLLPAQRSGEYCAFVQAWCPQLACRLDRSCAGFWKQGTHACRCSISGTVTYVSAQSTHFCHEPSPSLAFCLFYASVS